MSIMCSRNTTGTDDKLEEEEGIIYAVVIIIIIAIIILPVLLVCPAPCTRVLGFRASGCGCLAPCQP